jgi:hypothetical protein
LAFLPNLQILTLGDCLARQYPHYDYVDKLLDTVAERGLDVINGPLGRLKALRTTDSFNSQAILQNLSSFMILPELRVMSGFEYLATNDPGFFPGPNSFQWRFGSLMSNLETIKMAQSCISGREPNLASLLAHTPKLRCFCLEYRPHLQYRLGFDWDVSAVFRALEQYCSETIEELSITIEQLPGTLMAGLQSLEKFVRLEFLELDLRVFVR